MSRLLPLLFIMTINNTVLGSSKNGEQKLPSSIVPSPVNLETPKFREVSTVSQMIKIKDIVQAAEKFFEDMCGPGN